MRRLGVADRFEHAVGDSDSRRDLLNSRLQSNGAQACGGRQPGSVGKEQSRRDGRVEGAWQTRACVVICARLACTSAPPPPPERQRRYLRRCLLVSVFPAPLSPLTTTA